MKGVGWIPKQLPCENRFLFCMAFSVRSLYAPGGGGGANKPTARETSHASDFVNAVRDFP